MAHKTAARYAGELMSGVVRWATTDQMRAGPRWNTALGSA